MSVPKNYIKRTLVFTDDEDHSQEQMEFSNDVEYGFALAVKNLDSRQEGFMFNLKEVDALIEFLEDLRFRARHKKRKENR